MHAEKIAEEESHLKSLCDILPSAIAIVIGSFMQGTIFTYGNDVMLLTTRRIILEKAGYTVFTAESLPNAALVLMNHQVDVFVLCQSLSDEERRAVLETAHMLQPAIKIAALSFDDSEVTIDGVNVIRGPYQPHSLIEAIDQMFRSKTA